MNLKGLLDGLIGRAPWFAAARPLLLKAGFIIHRGSQETIASALREPRDDTRTALLDSLLREHLVAGEKLIRLIKLQPGEHAKLLAWIRSKRIGQSPLVDAFPGVADPTTIRAAATAGPSSAGFVELESGAAAIFTSVRSFLDRVEVPNNKLVPGAADGYEQIYALQRKYVQTYDAIWVPTRGDYACLAADLPLSVPSGFARDSQTELEAQIRKALGRSVHPMNLWPAVDGLYRSGEGRLVDYGFVNNKEAVKHHTARRGGKSLRDDEYDKAGATAVGDDLIPFKTAIAWARPGGSSLKAQPEILLPGTAQLVQVGNARLEHAVVRNCLNSRDLEFVVSKVLPFAV